ncbi:LLM class flavin-dependent oxidoreductase [Georgenia yuyongxinii]|uniref:LLM class flavin-dependent oxidoreductase n=1 Tax=Georgenia yuyongxinii TaxID=2589797 RepID=A0A552WU38_9MICO|nr:LLM class flavin-dependent oxidoreductase [Georgenia yuyongxinii]TRW45843.1 LLM class flavin-dependent oxidoreductase [Georgenia yuyongxinii]
MPVPLSILDLATVDGGTVADTFTASVELARRAEDRGYTRYWFAEHHNMPTIASSATAVLIGHIAARTTSIRVGAGGVMLPNHSPLVVAEQFGTLATLHPGRIDLGLGRAPGGDQHVFRALRRDPAASDRFPQDVVELQALLGDPAPNQLVRAIPGEGTRVPLFVLGSSLFGARLAAPLGLPYSFASHFAPAALEDAVRVYRAEYRPSAEHPEPYVIAALNVFAADTDEAAQAMFTDTLRRRVVQLARPGVDLSLADADAVLASPAGEQVRQMLRYSAVGAPEAVKEQVAQFARLADADELIVATNAPTADRLRSYELLAEAWGLPG